MPKQERLHRRYQLTIVDDRARDSAEAADRLRALKLLSLPSNGFVVESCQQLAAFRPVDDRAKLDAEFDAITREGIGS